MKTKLTGIAFRGLYDVYDEDGNKTGVQQSQEAVIYEAKFGMVKDLVSLLTPKEEEG